MKKIIFSVLAVILLISTVSCSQTQMYAQELKSGKKYDTSPEVSYSDMETLAKVNNEFALALYRQLSAADDGNMFFSPYSLSVALAMTYAGAEGATREQMAKPSTSYWRKRIYMPPLIIWQSSLPERRKQSGQG